VERLEKDLKRAAKDIGSFRKLCMAEGAIRLVVDRKSFITPVAFARPLGVFSGGSHMAQILQALIDEDVVRGRPTRVAVIVNSRTLVPGAGYFQYMREKHKVEVPKDEDAEEAYWMSQLAELGYPYDVDQVPIIGVDDIAETTEAPGDD
jgi:hypothetical protein